MWTINRILAAITLVLLCSIVPVDADEVGCCVCKGECRQKTEVIHSEVNALLCQDGTDTAEACQQACRQRGGSKCEPANFMRHRSCGSGCGTGSPLKGELR